LGILSSLIRRNPDYSASKSYFAGIERGRYWAQNIADYFEVREWSEADIREFEDLTLPHEEAHEFRLMSHESAMDWRTYLQGWLEGVREISGRP